MRFILDVWRYSKSARWALLSTLSGQYLTSLSTYYALINKLLNVDSCWDIALTEVFIPKCFAECSLHTTSFWHKNGVILTCMSVNDIKWTPLLRYSKQHFINTQHLYKALRWRHNGRDSVSNHQPHGCLLNRLFRRRSKKTSKLRVTGLCAGNSPGTGEFPA